MNQAVPTWTIMVGPVATLLGTMLVVMLGVSLQNRALERAVDLLRAELKQQLAEIELRITRHILELAHRVERLGGAWIDSHFVAVHYFGNAITILPMPSA
jgi:sensor domain CHASE-containing protein